ncbi:hypothetical protein F66182_1907 [Fusarium sp. NRRL 66182]|nr:hypothetical protein F66182_1907 [Fusarium sp. NRRL 66182]
MLKQALLFNFSLLMLAEQALGFGCSTHSFTTCEDNIVHWFDPDDGMICDPLDCGGGRAPPKTNVPGCGGYTGTETIGTSYLSCWKPSTTLALTTAETTAEAEATEDAEPTTETSDETKTTTRNTNDAGEGSSASTQTEAASTTGPTTSAAALPTQTQSDDDTASTPTVAPNAARTLEGSMMAIVGVVAGAMILI